MQARISAAVAGGKRFHAIFLRLVAIVMAIGVVWVDPPMATLKNLRVHGELQELYFFNRMGLSIYTELGMVKDARFGSAYRGMKQVSLDWDIIPRNMRRGWIPAKVRSHSHAHHASQSLDLQLR